MILMYLMNVLINCNDNWINWKQDRLLFSEVNKFAPIEIDGVRTVEFKHYAHNLIQEKISSLINWVV
jgi:hypothetical protein